MPLVPRPELYILAKCMRRRATTSPEHVAAVRYQPAVSIPTGVSLDAGYLWVVAGDKGILALEVCPVRDLSERVCPLALVANHRQQLHIDQAELAGCRCSARITLTTLGTEYTCTPYCKHDVLP